MVNLHFCLYGKANEVLTPMRVMRAAIIAGARRTNKQNRRVIIGKDTRLPNYMVEAALVSGFTAAGLEVVQTGPVPIAGIAFLTRSLRCSLGVMITAPNAPFCTSGIVLFSADGSLVHQDEQSAIGEAACAEETSSLPLPPPGKMGSAKRFDGPIERIIEVIKRSVAHVDLCNLRIVVDCANGAAYRWAPTALWELGVDTVAIGTSPNGRNINEGCGLHVPQVVIKKVLEVRADFGIAFDGAGNNILLVEKSGAVIPAPLSVASDLGEDGLVRALHTIGTRHAAHKE